MSLQEAYISSPFGMISSFFYGTIQSALFTLLAVYAATMNFSIVQISLVTFHCYLSISNIGKRQIFMIEKSYYFCNISAVSLRFVPFLQGNVFMEI